MKVETMKFVQDARALVPGLLAGGVFLAWTASEGGYPATTWYPGALFLLGLLVVVTAVRRPRLSGVARWSGLFLGAFCAWSFLSVLWADVRGDAWDGANRTLLYLTVYVLFVFLPWRSRGAAMTLGAFAAGTAAIGTVVLLKAAASSDPESYFTGGRFAEPAGYANANCALWLAAFWPALLLASRREVPWPVRGLLMGVAGVLLELALLPQSRGALFAAPVVALLYFAVVPGRVRSLIALSLVAVVGVASLDPILDVWSTDTAGGDLGGALDRSIHAIAISFVVLVIGGTVLALADRGLVVSERLARRAGRVVAAFAALGALLGAFAFVNAVGNPAAWASNQWHEFSAGDKMGEGTSRFSGGLGSNRYDFWRVGVGEFVESPVIGVGADNFAVDYVRRRQSDEEPLYPHSLEIRFLAQTGIVGTGLFLGFLLFALAGVWRTRARTNPFGRAVAAICVVAFGYWAIHGSGDWFWEFPALAAPAFAWLGMAVALGRQPGLQDEPERPAAPRTRTIALIAAGGALALLAAASYGLPWIAAKDVDLAGQEWASDSAGAAARLDRARRLNFLSDEPDLVAGAIASRQSDPDAMRAAFTRALARNPSNWYAHLELGVAEAAQGRRPTALSELQAAQRLNPSEPVIDSVIEDVQAGKTPALEEVDRAFLERVE